jgi:hypothetical protein
MKEGVSKYDNHFKTGEQIGQWTILDNKIHYKSKNSDALILVRCKCGKEKYIHCRSLVNNPLSKCITCRKGSEHPRFSGYKEIPGSWFVRFNVKKKKLEFNITIKDVYKLWIKQNKQCALSGLPIDFINQGFKLESNRENSKQKYKYDLICTASLDRIDSSKGYIKGNIQLVHKDVNIMKNEYEQERFIEICQLVAKNNK